MRRSVSWLAPWLGVWLVLTALLCGLVWLGGKALEAGGARGAACPPGPQSLLAGVVRTSVVVHAPPYQGSGTLVGLDGEVLVLTARHVIRALTPAQPGLDLEYYGRPGRHRARVVWADPMLDLALLRPYRPPGLPVARLGPACLPLDLGEDTWYCGAGGGLRWNLQRGLVNQDRADWTVVNGGGWYGHSGSGVFVRRGTPARYLLVGVLVGMASDPGEAPEVDNPRVPCRVVTRAHLHAFLSGYRARPFEATRACGKGVPGAKE